MPGAVRASAVEYIDDVKHARILVVDDEPVNVKLLVKILRAEGYDNIVSTDDSRKVQDLLEAQPSDLMLLDLNMPYMTGFDVMAQLNGLFIDEAPSILVLTAQSDRDSRIQALELGARDYVTKPFDRVELLTRIRNMLEVNLLHRQIRDQNRILEQKVQARTHELQETRLEIIRRLGRAAEYRDNETGLHIIRMSKISALLAESAGLSSFESQRILNASPMHDIGKIGIPDSILLKPGKLEAGEWEIMKTHAAIGGKILSGHESELLSMARVIAETHHEKWDGSGYPNGLSGDNIPIAGRIVALADVFDALTSERPYKKEWPINDAVEFIESNSGKHFDPTYTEVFMACLPRIVEIKQKYAEPEGEV